MKEFNGKKMLDHIFIDRKAGVSQAGNSYEFQKAGIHVERFIEELRQVKTNEKGFANFVISSQKANPERYSMYVDDWQPTQTNGNTASKTKGTPTPSTSDLPF